MQEDEHDSDSSSALGRSWVHIGLLCTFYAVGGNHQRLRLRNQVKMCAILSPAHTDSYRGSKETSLSQDSVPRGFEHVTSPICGTCKYDER
jgi:hypothetical protein